MTTDTLKLPDSSDWNSILQSRYRWLTSILYARLRDTHAVEEVMQETALAASRQPTIPTDDEGICKWLYRVAVRQSLLYRRRQYRDANRINGYVSQKNLAVHDGYQWNPFRLLLASEQQELVRNAFQQLPPRDCEVLILKYNEGWNCREIARRIGVTETAVKSRLLRARKNMRNLLMKVDESWELP
jgi:RNA polymerase sigma-70 factor (ECF subfamily)